MLGGIANADNDIIVEADSTEAVLGLSIALALALGLTISGAVTVQLVAPQTRAIIAPLAIIHAKGNVMVSAVQRGDLTATSGGGGLALLATVGAAVSVNSVVKTTLAFVSILAIVRADGQRGTVTAYTGDDDDILTFSVDERFTQVRGLVVQAVSFQNFYTIAMAGGASLLASANITVTAQAMVSVTRAWIDHLAIVNPLALTEGHQNQVVIVRATDDTFFLGLALSGSAAFIVAATVAVDGGLVIKNTEAYIAVGAHVDSNGDIFVQAFSRELIVSLEFSKSASFIAGLAGSAGVYIMVVNTRAHIGDVPIGGTTATAGHPRPDLGSAGRQQPRRRRACPCRCRCPASPASTSSSARSHSSTTCRRRTCRTCR